MTRSSVTHEVPFVVQAGANEFVEVSINPRVFQVSLKRSLCQLPDVDSYLLYVVSLTTVIHVCFLVEVSASFLMYPTWTANGGVEALNSGSGTKQL